MICTRKVACETFFHVNQLVSYNKNKPIKVGDTVTVGDRENPFFGHFCDEKKFSLKSETGIRNLLPIDFLRQVKEGKIDCPKLPDVAHETARHLSLFSRELLFELARLEVNALAPSRTKCMWLANSLEEAFKWSDRLAEGSKIFELEATGWVHSADASILTAEFEGFEVSKTKAFDYWHGKLTNKPEIEHLFVGSARIIREVGYPSPVPK